LEQSVPVLIGIFIFFNPFPHTTAIKEICYYLSVLIVLVLILFKKKGFTFQTPLLLPVSLFVFWAFLSIFFAIDKENSIHDFYSHLLRYIILFFILTNFFNSRKRLIYLSWIIIISSCIFIFGGLTYNYLIIGQNLSSRFGLTSTFAQASFNIIGVTSVFAFILGSNQLYNEKNLYLKTFLVFSLMTLFIGLLLSQTRSLIIALSFSIFVFFYKNKKWMSVFLSLVLMMFIISPVKNRFMERGPSSIFSNVRIRMNYLTLEVIKEYPIIGIGFGLQTYGKLDLEEYEKRLPKKKRQTDLISYITADPHNMVLDIAVRLGVVGLGFFFYIIGVFLKMCWNIIKYGKDKFIQDWGRCLAAAFIGVSVIGLLQPIFSHMPEVVLCTIFSMTTIVWRLNNEPSQKIGNSKTAISH
jgi:O-antigen ligase